MGFRRDDRHSSTMPALHYLGRANYRIAPRSTSTLTWYKVFRAQQWSRGRLMEGSFFWGTIKENRTVGGGTIIVEVTGIIVQALIQKYLKHAVDANPLVSVCKNYQIQLLTIFTVHIKTLFCKLSCNGIQYCSHNYGQNECLFIILHFTQYYNKNLLKSMNLWGHLMKLKVQNSKLFSSN